MRNDITTAETLITKYQDFMKTKFQASTNSITQHNIHDYENLVIYCSMSKEKLGNILEASLTIQALGYTPEQVVEKNVNMLLPNCWQTAHQEVLADHIEAKSIKSRINQNLNVLVKSKSGMLLPYKLYITVCPNFEEEVIYVGILKPNPKSET